MNFHLPFYWLVGDYPMQWCWNFKLQGRKAWAMGISGTFHILFMRQLALSFFLSFVLHFLFYSSSTKITNHCPLRDPCGIIRAWGTPCFWPWQLWKIQRMTMQNARGQFFLQFPQFSFAVSSADSLIRDYLLSSCRTFKPQGWNAWALGISDPFQHLI